MCRARFDRYLSLNNDTHKAYPCSHTRYHSNHYRSCIVRFGIRRVHYSSMGRRCGEQHRSHSQFRTILPNSDKYQWIRRMSHVQNNLEDTAVSCCRNFLQDLSCSPRHQISSFHRPSLNYSPVRYTLGRRRISQQYILHGHYISGSLDNLRSEHCNHRTPMDPCNCIGGYFRYIFRDQCSFHDTLDFREGETKVPYHS